MNHPNEDLDRKLGWCALILLGFFLLLFLFAPPKAKAESPPCAVALVLLMDVSGSVDAQDYASQRDGTAAALRSNEIVRAIESQPGGVAITAVEWGDFATQTLPWHLIKTRDEAESFADALAATPRRGRGGTYLGQALQVAETLLDDMPCQAEREIIDVSTDGDSSDPVDTVRGRLAARGVTINALVIPDARNPATVEWYREDVVTNGGFVIVASSYDVYGPAIRRKLILELASLN